MRRNRGRHAAWRGVLVIVLAASLAGCGSSSLGTQAVVAWSHGAPPSAGRSPAPPALDVARSWVGPLRGALALGLKSADAAGGTGAAAIWVQGWRAPIVAGDTARLGRVWSVSKAVTVTALAEALHGKLSRAVSRATVDAITRSDNCAARRLALGLTDLLGSQSAAVAAFKAVLSRAGARVHGRYQVAPIEEDQDCEAYLEATRNGLSDPLAPAIQVGVFTWTIADAIRFAYALDIGRYGAGGKVALAAMRLPKTYVLEPGARLDYTSPLDRPPAGGDFPAQWLPGYKGGWGGAEQDDFVAEQIVALHIHGRAVAIAAMFWPTAAMPNDDPGRGVAPVALRSIMEPLQTVLAHVSARS